MNDLLPSDPIVLFLLAVQTIHNSQPDAASRLDALSTLLQRMTCSTDPAVCGEVCAQTIDLYTNGENNNAQPLLI